MLDVVSAINAVKARQASSTPRLKACMRFVGAKAVHVRPLYRSRMRAAASKACNFEGSAYNGGIMYPEMTIDGVKEDGPVVLDLDTLVIPKPQCPVLDDHTETTDGIVGLTSEIAVRKSDYTMPVRGVVCSPKIADGQAGGIQWQLSVGTNITSIERVPAGKSVRVNNRNFIGPLTVIRGAVLTDLSFVRLGGDDTTWATLAARKALAAAQSRKRNPAMKRLIDAIELGRTLQPTA